MPLLKPNGWLPTVINSFFFYKLSGTGALPGPDDWLIKECFRRIGVLIATAFILILYYYHCDYVNSLLMEDAFGKAAIADDIQFTPEDKNLQGFVNRIPAAVAVMDAALQLKFANTRFLQLLNGGQELPAGISLQALFPDAILQVEAFNQLPTQKNGEKQLQRVPYRTVPDSDSINYFNLNFQSLNAGQAGSDIIVYATEVVAGSTATHSAEEVFAMRQLQEREKRFHALINATSEIVYQMNADWSAVRKLEGRGFLQDTVEPDTNWIQKYVHPEDRAKVQEAVVRAISKKEVFELEHRVLMADGTGGWVFSRAVPIIDENEEVVEWFGAAVNITPHREAEQALTEAMKAMEARKRLYDAVTASTPDLIYVFDLNYRFIYANKALLTMWGRTESESIGKGLSELGYEPWHAEMHEREIDQVVATRKAVRGEVSFPHATLGRRMYDYIFTPILNEQGEVEAIAGTTRDISEIKEEESRLEQLVAERTQELQRSNNDLLQFAHVASHDLKEPVRKIKTFAGRLKDDKSSQLSAEGEKYLGKIHSASDRMFNMIEGVLAYSTADNTYEQFEQLNVTSVIDSIETDLELPISNKAATVQFKQLPEIWGAPVLVYQLFYNLISNSLKFARAGVPLEIQVQGYAAVQDAVAGVVIELTDNGIGFSQDAAGSIFNTFTRLHPKDKYEGTGLGLALCKKIMDRHRGTIRASGKEEAGATFSMFFPARNLL